ncbi:MAG: M48 family peptidase [Proteobacteria bacterium]|nr:M48 family peptidase [Pseudomonadota bacterium]
MSSSAHSLCACRQDLNDYRYPHDISKGCNASSPELLRHLRSFYLHESLKASPSITPRVEKAIQGACQSIKLSRECVEVFIFNSDQTNAQSIALSKEKCIVRISSRLVDLLSLDELRFVIGHELGHFIYEHSIRTDSEEGLDEEGFLLSKAAEVSSDRIGLLACRSTLDATRAILKSISGLSSQHLGHDFSDFLDQFEEQTAHSDLSGFFTSHPSFLVRARALLWFDLVRSESDSSKRKQRLEDLNKRITVEMDRVFNRHSHKKIHKAEKDVYLWLCLKKSLEDGVFSKSEQRFFEEEFGADVSAALKALITEQNHEQVSGFIEKEIERTTQTLRKVLPRRFEETMKRLYSQSSLAL